MSLVRFGEDGSNVYVYYSTSGIECCGCSLERYYTAADEEEMIAHLNRHIESGDCVPDEVFKALQEEARS